jgi:hypothetical protein
MPYAFRLRVVFPPGRGISAVEDDAMPMAVLPGEGAEVTLHAWTAHPLNATELIIKGFGYESSEEARSRGERIQRALRATGAELHLPMDFGPDRARSFFFTRGLELLRERGVLRDEQVESDVHGLHVFEHGEQRVVFGPGDAHPTMSRPVVDVLSALERWLDALPAIDERLALAIDLRFLAEFEKSTRARFVTVMTSLEVLADQRPRPEVAARHVEALISSTRTLKNKTDSDGRRALDSLLGALEGLRVQSITSAVGDLVRTHAPGLVVDNVPADRFAVRCYSIRSDLVHEGRSEECDAALPHLQLLADEILLRMMRATS